MKQVIARPFLLSTVFIAIFAIIGGIFLSRSLFAHKSFAKTVHPTSLSSCGKTVSCKTLPISATNIKKEATATPTPSATPTLSEQNVQNQTTNSGFCLNVPVLLYHHIQPQAIAVQNGQTSLTVDNNIFDSQMAYLATNGYHTISAEALVNAVISHTQLPPKTVVVTADDGYLDIFTYAYPTIQKYHIILNVMVPTGLVGVTSGTNTYYTWDELKQMVDSGMVFAYNHTWSHYPLAQGPVSKDIYEITTAQTQLQQHLGKADPILVYPYGSGQGIAWVENLVKQQGYVAAFSTLYGRYQCDSNLMALPRIHIGNAPLPQYGI